jgi:hypothetical protein
VLALVIKMEKPEEITFEITPIEMVERLKHIIEKEGGDWDSHLRIRLQRVEYRKNAVVWKLKPLPNKNAARKKL